jgi:redox-sensitive bicupin YhaK (pirin superfamily)
VADEIEIWQARASRVGALPVARALPVRAHRTVGAWCFADLMGPVELPAGEGADVAPHPHCGLQTVTWLFDGEILHRDSLGSEQVIRPGQCNLMSAGHGVAHSEESPTRNGGRVHGIQLWAAQPATMRDGAAAFEHHGELPRVALTGARGDAEATVFVGEFAEASSPARRDWESFGAEVLLRGAVAVPLVAAHEHLVVVIDGAVRVDDTDLEPGEHAYLPTGRGGATLHATVDARVVLLGGMPFPEELTMWWNFVARSRDEISAAWQQWSDGDDRFPEVASPMPRIEIAPPAWHGLLSG